MKRTLSLVLSVIILLSMCMPVFAANTNYKDYHSAYIDVLEEYNSRISQYNFAQYLEDYKSSTGGVITIADITGDSIPELLFLCQNKEYPYAGDLMIWTYSNDAAKLILNIEIFDSQVAAGSRYCLFVSESGNLIIHNSIGDESWTDYYSEYKYSSGQLTLLQKLTITAGLYYNSEKDSTYTTGKFIFKGQLNKNGKESNVDFNKCSELLKSYSSNAKQIVLSNYWCETNKYFFYKAMRWCDKSFGGECWSGSEPKVAKTYSYKEAIDTLEYSSSNDAEMIEYAKKLWTEQYNLIWGYPDGAYFEKDWSTTIEYDDRLWCPVIDSRVSSVEEVQNYWLTYFTDDFASANWYMRGFKFINGELCGNGNGIGGDITLVSFDFVRITEQTWNEITFLVREVRDDYLGTTEEGKHRYSKEFYYTIVFKNGEWKCSEAVYTDGTPFIEKFGGNKYNKDNSIVFGTDQWSFKNYSGEPYYLVNIDYQKLVNGLSHTDMDAVNRIIYSEDGKTLNKSIGSCYGMSATVVLAKMGFFKPSAIYSGATSLYSIPRKNDDWTESFISFYHMQQITKEQLDLAYSFMTMSSTKQLQQIEDMASNVSNGGSPFMLCVQGNNSAHAVVGYGVEHGNFSVGGGLFGIGSTTYPSRILLYDCNYPNETTYMYYNKDTGLWQMQKYSQYTRLQRATSNVAILDYFTSGLVEDKSNNESDSAYLLSWSNTNKYTLIFDGEEISIDGNTDEREKGFVTYFNCSGDDSELMTLTLPASDKNYSIVPDEESRYLLNYGNFSLGVDCNNADKIDFVADSAVSLNGIDGDFSLSYVVNEKYQSLPWYKTVISGDDSDDISLTQTEDGLLLQGDLEGLELVLTDENDTQTLPLNTKENSILLTNESDSDDFEPIIMIDPDGDGIFDTLYKHTDNNGWGVNIPASIIAVAVAVLISICLIVALLIIKRIHNKKDTVNKCQTIDNSENDLENIEEKICSKCGTPFAEGGLFCAKCGNARKVLQKEQNEKEKF